jgi:hypothetical protein
MDKQHAENRDGFGKVYAFISCHMNLSCNSFLRKIKTGAAETCRSGLFALSTLFFRHAADERGGFRIISSRILPVRSS